MSEIFRKLASIRTISAIEPIEGADRIVLYKIDGWNVISQKDAFVVGDLCIYFEIDSFLPVRPAFEFLRKNCFKTTKNLGDGFRIKTMKMKGVVSQGLILPISDISGMVPVDVNVSFCDGDDLTELLSVQKYEKPIPNHLQGKIRGNFPSFIPKTDQERIQNIRRSDLDRHMRTNFELTTKMDGSSMTVYWKDGYFGVCSRNLDLKDETLDGGGENIFWKVAKGLLLDKRENVDNIAIQGELVGPGMNGNRARFDRHHFFVFDVWDITTHSYLSSKERIILCAKLGLEHVPVIKNVQFGYFLPDKEFLLEYAEEVTTKNEVGLELPGEGFVAKSEDGSFSWKAISNKYLLESED